MKKLILLICVVLFVVSCEMSNSSNNSVSSTEPESMKISSSFANGDMDISGAIQLGISTKKVSNTRGVDDFETIEVPYLVKDDGTGLNDEVKIKDSNEDYYLNEGDLGVEIYKLQTVYGYTIVSYISSKVRENLIPVEYSYSIGKQQFKLYYYKEIWMSQGVIDNDSSRIGDYGQYMFDITKGVPMDFNDKCFMNSDFVKTYIIDNSTGKIYSTESFSAFDIVNGVIAVRPSWSESSYEFYDIQTVGDELQLKSLVPNSDIKVVWVYKDKDGWSYIGNENYEGVDTANKICYLKEDSFCHDKLGNIYKAGAEYLYKQGIKQKLDFSSDIYIEGLFPIKQYNSTDNSKSGNKLVTSKLSLFYEPYILATTEGIFQWIGSFNPSGDVLLEGNKPYWVNDGCTAFYSLVDGNVVWQKINWDDVSSSSAIKSDYSEPILTGVEYYGDYYQMQNNQIIKIADTVRKVGLTGSEYYTFTWNESKNCVEPVLLLQTTTTSKVFAIKELK